MEERTRNHEYRKLATIPKSIQWNIPGIWMSDAITNINDSEILFAHPGKIIGDQRGIYKYNVHFDEWQLFIQYPADIDLRDQCAHIEKNEFGAVLLAFNRSENTLFLKPNMMRFFEIDMVSKKFKTYRATETPEHNNVVPTCDWEQLLNVGNEIHLTSLSVSRCHFVWNPEIERFDDTINTQEFDKIRLHRGGWVAYLPNKETLIHFGGYLMGTESGTDRLFVCQRNHNKKWIWRLIEQRFDCRTSRSYSEECAWLTGVVSADGNYVVISLMFDGNKIYVADVSDLDNIKMNKCSIKAPMDHTGFANRIGFAVFRTGNTIKLELLVSGFVRQSFQDKALKHLNLPPIHLNNIMAKFHNEEMIHWMMERIGVHWAIPLKRILSSRISVEVK